MQRRAISPQGGVWWAALCAEQLATSEPPDTYERLVEDVLSPPFAAAIVGGDLVDVAKVR